LLPSGKSRVSLHSKHFSARSAILSQRTVYSPSTLCLQIGILLLVLAFPLNAQRSATPASGLPDEGRYANLPFPDIVAHSLQTPRLQLSDIWREKPVLLTLVFTRCAGICSPFLMSLKSAVDTIGGAGRDYRVVVLSFDPQDTPDDMAALAGHIGVRGAGWIFGTSTAAEIERIAQSTGFWFQWDTERSQFDHPAMLVGVRDGRIARLLVGGDVLPVRLKEVVDELRGEFVPAYPLPGRALFRCFQYDPAVRRFKPDWGFLLLLLPGCTALFGTFWVFRSARRISRSLPP
jgi:protein SCO1